MRSANDFYNYIMPRFRILNSQSPFIHFLQEQMFDIMGGVHISDADKIKSMQILLKAASQIDEQKELHGALLNELIQTIETHVGLLRDEHNDRVERSQHYMSDFLNHRNDETNLTQMYGRKPWQLQDKNSPSTRAREGLKKPGPDSRFPGAELTQTLGEYGWEFPENPDDSFTQQVKQSVSGDEKKRVLILGAGFGDFAYTLLKASEHNASEVVVNDLSVEQMAIFRDNLPITDDSRVTIVSGSFLDAVDFPDALFDSILVNNVMHFFTPEQVDRCVNRIRGWLKPGGEVAVTTCTPYWKVHQECGTLDTFEQRKAKQEEWPGYFENLRSLLAEKNHPMARVAPARIHAFDPEVLRGIFSTRGLTVSKAGFFRFPSTVPAPWKDEIAGRENAGIIAFRPH